MTEQHFPHGELSRGNFDSARLAARLKLRPVKAFFREASAIEAVGTSGTINSTEAVARELGVIESNDLTPGSIERLIDRVIEFDNIDDLQLPGLSERRSQVWPGGLAILVELMKVLRIEHLKVSDGALREGLLYDHIGRLQHEDARERSVSALANRYNVDLDQADRVAQTAGALFRQVASAWQFESALATNVVQWAARLHEIGLDISHDGFQKHGAYVAENADLPGFPRSEQKLLAWLIASQRSAFDKRRLRALPTSWQDHASKLSIVLRLAVLLNRSRGSLDLSGISATAKDNRLRLAFPSGWLDANPLTVADLNWERRIIDAIDHELEFD